jgi:endonuclease YncB( thermonuclease family)
MTESVRARQAALLREQSRVEMEYRIEIVDTWNRRITTVSRTHLLEVTRGFVTDEMRVAGMLPADLVDVGHEYELRVYLEDRLEARVPVRVVDPQWGERKKLVLDRFVNFHKIIEVDARRDYDATNTLLNKAYTSKEVSEIVKDAIESVTGEIHYLVDHNSYPDGAEREFDKFTGRLVWMTEFPVGSVESGEYVGGSRIDASGAYAKDGDTIAGLVVDGEEWPDLRLMMIDTEELSINAHTIKVHPEVATWTDEKYARSGYKLSGDRATDALQDLIDTKGIQYVELSWHRDATGGFDNRVDAYGRYIGLVYGGGECFNAAMVELGHSGVYLYGDGAYNPPEMKLKEYYSYVGPNADSVETTAASLSNLDLHNGIYEVLTLLAYAAGGYVWSIDQNEAVTFREVVVPDRVIFYDPKRHAVSLRSNSSDVVNRIQLLGNPVGGQFGKSYTNTTSVEEFGFRERTLELFSVSQEQDADVIVWGLLDDVAYPEQCGVLTFLDGDAAITPGEVVEVRGGDIDRITRRVGGEYGDVFHDGHVFRVARKETLIRNCRVETRCYLAPVIRSVADPLGFIVRSQPSAETFFQFRLDDDAVGLDMGFHLD